MASASTTASYEIHLPQFEGPFDLLLFFIQRDELDIHDIPISQITQDFLEYIRKARELEINLAAEFMVVAAQLMKIKARLLLPRQKATEEEQAEDPRTELIDRLIAYKQYKAAAEELKGLEAAELKRFFRGNPQAEAQHIKGDDTPEDELQGLTLFRILKVYQQVLERQARKLQESSHTVHIEPYSMEDIREGLERRLRSGKRVKFLEIVNEQPDAYYLVVNFLAVLELLNQRKLRVILGEGYNHFWLEGREPEAEPPLPKQEEDTPNQQPAEEPPVQHA